MIAGRWREYRGERKTEEEGGGKAGERGERSTCRRKACSYIADMIKIRVET